MWEKNYYFRLKIIQNTYYNDFEKNMKKKWFRKSCCELVRCHFPTYHTYLPSAYIDLSLLWKVSLIYTGRWRRVLRFFFSSVSFGPLLAFYGAKGLPRVPFRRKRRMFVKKKINLDFLWIHKHSNTTHNPRGAAGSYWEREKNLSFVRKTLRFICVRLTHNCRQVIIIFFCP